MKIKNSILCIVALSALLFSFSGCTSVKDRLELSVTDETAEATTALTTVTTAAATEPVATTEPSVPDIPDVPDETGGEESDAAKALKLVSEARAKTYGYDVEANGHMSYEVPSSGMFNADIKADQDYTLLTHTDENGNGSYSVSVSDGTNSSSYTCVDGRIYICAPDGDGNMSLRVVEIPDGEDADIPDLTAFLGDENGGQIPGVEDIALDKLFGKAEIKSGMNGSSVVTFSEADAEFINSLIMSLLSSGASGEETDHEQDEIMPDILPELFDSDALAYDVQAIYTVDADGCLVNEDLRVSISVNIQYSEGLGSFALEMFRLETETEYRTVAEGITITAPENADEYEEITLEELLGSFDIFGETVTVDEETEI